jgi:hypothetical protein
MVRHDDRDEGPLKPNRGEVVLRARMLPVEKLDMIEGPSRSAEE